MIASCLNCGTEFLHASEGRLFYHTGKTRQGSFSGSPSAQAPEVEFYWLCQKCSVTHTLKLDQDGQVHVISAPREGDDPGDFAEPRAPGSPTCPNCSVLALANE